MPQFLEAHNTIRGYFNAQIVVPQSLIVAWDNMSITPPENAIWARATIRLGNASLVEIGKQKTTRQVGAFIIQLFGPLETGDNAILTLADLIDDKFRNISNGGILYRTPSIVNVGITDKWYQVNLICPLQFDHSA